MNNDNTRKKRIIINLEIFNIIKRLYKVKSKSELMEITSLGKSALNEAIRRIYFSSDSDPSFENLYKKAGRKHIQKEELYIEIRSIMGNDNSLTQIGCREILSDRDISLPQLSRAFKSAGLFRKRLKKRSNTRVTLENMSSRQNFCGRVLGLRLRPILFLDESGFNLHTSTNYGYSQVNKDPVLYQPSSRGRNISLCTIISSCGIENYKMIDGAYTGQIFYEFLMESFEKGIFQNQPVLIMDNVKFHSGEQVKNYFISKGIQVLMLPTYSPDLNPIENVFSCIKSRLNAIRPRATTRETLKEDINSIIGSLTNFNNYYLSFWELVNGINNRQVN